MSSPRVLASLLALSAAGLMIASCGEPTLPTTASSVTAPAAFQSPSLALVDMLVDPAGPLGTLADGPPPTYPSGSAPDPWPPGPPPKAQPGVPVPSEPTVSADMHVNIEAEPAQHSGVPVPIAGCDNHPYTWYYEQVIVNDSGLAITITERENFFDNRYTSTSRQAIQIRGNGTVRLLTRWCSGYAKPHFAQTRLNGRREDGQPFIFSEPRVRLLAP